MKKYTAPWSTSLILISLFATVICVGVAISAAVNGRAWLAVVPAATICGAILFTIRGYSVSQDTLLVHRLFWTTRLALSDLRSARVEPEAMRRSIRTFGNGGLFSFTGWFRNSALGAYRAFVTDPRRAVVLHFPTRTVVVSPSAPDEFVRDIGSPSRAV